MTFTLSICLIYALEAHRGAALGALAAVCFACGVLPQLLSGTDFAVDYGLWGVLLAVPLVVTARSLLWSLAGAANPQQGR